MTIDEAIKICEEDAEKIGGNPQSDRHAERCRQLAEWLTELKEAKQLLKVAVEDFHDVLTSQIKITNYTLCGKCKYYLNCNCKDECLARYDLKQWRYAEEALKLIGEDKED